MTDTEYQKWFETELADEPVSLSAAGCARRGAMQLELQTAVVSRRRRRTTVRWSAGALAAALLTAVLWPTPETAPSAPGNAPGERLVALSYCDYGLVRDDALAMQRYTAPAAALPAETWVDDDQLVALLAAADRRTGLIRTPQRVVLTHDVIDRIGE